MALETLICCFYSLYQLFYAMCCVQIVFVTMWVLLAVTYCFLQKECYFGNGLFSSMVGESEEQVKLCFHIHNEYTIFFTSPPRHLACQ